MLSSITPLGERGRHATWGVTVIAFLLAATAAGAAAGAAAAALGQLVIPASVAPDARLAALAVALVAAIALDARPRGVPGPRRQVNERWLDEYRGWVYGLGYGAQLGLGVATVVSSAATYVALIAAFLTRDVASGALILGGAGALRGVQPLAAAHVRSPAQLIAAHAVLARWRDRARWSGVAALGAVLAAALVGAIA